MSRTCLVLTLILVTSSGLAAQNGEGVSTDERLSALEKKLERSAFAVDALRKRVDDLLWFERVGDVADVDKVYFPTVPNPRDEETYGIENERHPFKMYSYVFVPKGIDRSRKHPLLVFPHGGVHGDFNTYYTHIIRELMAEGYAVIAPEYRGSTGYGRSYYEAIDYGGIEIEDVVAARDWAVEQMSFIDKNRVGMPRNMRNSFAVSSNSSVDATAASSDLPETTGP